MTLVSVNAFGQTLPGTLIQNQAEASYLDPGGVTVTVSSNPVDIITVATRTPADLSFNRISGSGTGLPVGPTACAQGGAYLPLPDPVLLGNTSIDPSQPQTLAPTAQFHAGEPVFITLSDLDQNLDPGVRETIIVNLGSTPAGDTETLRLTETDVDTGVFAGYLQTARPPATPGDCVLQVGADGDLTGTYQDPDDSADSAQADALVDPTNIVFDASTGNALDGAIVRLVDAVTGAPATVYGADGVAQFPSSIISGASISDSSGQLYTFQPGGYRFPVVPPGDYRIEIEPPSGFAGFSALSVDELQTLPGAPFDLDAGSFGSSFTVGDVLAFTLDLPIDPQGSALYLQKSVANTIASLGDFVQYALRLDNSSAVVQQGVTVTDVLPVGFRLMPDSTYIDDIAAPDPVIGSDGRTLNFVIGDLAAQSSVRIRYVTEVTVGASGDRATNTARALSATGTESNLASATLQLVEDLFQSTSILVGRAVLGSCDDEVGNDLQGVGGLRVYMEDGRYALTDDGGRFHFEGLVPGTHVVQLDLETVPAHLEVFDCETNSRFAGRSFSRFVDLRAGSLWRADFYLRERPLPTGMLSLELDGRRAAPDTIEYEIGLSGGELPVADLVVSMVLPKGLVYLADSSRIGGETRLDPDERGNSLSYRLGDLPPGWTETITLRARLGEGAEGELDARAVALFGMPNGERGRTPVADNRFIYRPELSETVSASLTSNFANLSARLTEGDRRALDALIAEWRGSDDVVLFATGHTDSNPIRPGHPVFPDNYVLSVARAEAAARYVGGAL
ncbi:MAG: hypothetical protein WBN65_07215, partial [Gammaproteobacteria bacterium]